MELRIDIDTRVRKWLSSMGYPVAGMPPEMLYGMLLREARQWEISPEALCAMIEEGSTRAADAQPSGGLMHHDFQDVPSGRQARMSI